jgi:hypothetical protein
MGRGECLERNRAKMRTNQFFAKKNQINSKCESNGVLSSIKRSE